MTDSSGTCDFPTTSSLKILRPADDNSDSCHVRSKLTSRQQKAGMLCVKYALLGKKKYFFSEQY